MSFKQIYENQSIHLVLKDFPQKQKLKTCSLSVNTDIWFGVNYKLISMSLNCFGSLLFCLDLIKLRYQGDS
jgi:hypothetical protein